MTKTTPELALPKLPHHTSTRTVDRRCQISVHQVHMHSGSSVESGFEPGTLWPEALLQGHRVPASGQRRQYIMISNGLKKRINDCQSARQNPRYKDMT
ncbi:hypothetical protein AVEN_175706-1 [Araneus ventricosus]|uniref:Uncharacterized protein n=1 Tax=Araneus ventricosus TaxID=182803 RepID=A0A4Y2G7N9_ARAVE|nr:hypothetical protein AVEN_175706-1 [Araneus ventricosus]